MENIWALGNGEQNFENNMISPNKNDLIAKIWQRLAYYDTSLIFPMRNRLQTVSAHNGSWTKLVFINLIKVCIMF